MCFKIWYNQPLFNLSQTSFTSPYNCSARRYDKHDEEYDQILYGAERPSHKYSAVYNKYDPDTTKLQLKRPELQPEHPQLPTEQPEMQLKQPEVQPENANCN